MNRYAKVALIIICLTSLLGYAGAARAQQRARSLPSTLRWSRMPRWCITLKP